MISNGKATCIPYLEWHDHYVRIMTDMGGLNQSVLAYEQILDDKQQARVISQFRRQLIRLRREWAKADTILNAIDKHAE